MNVAEQVNYVQLKLGEQTAFYTTEEIVVNGLNPAQRLLCLAHPRLLLQRFAFTLGEEQPFIDLRQITDNTNNIVGTRIRRIMRVSLGDNTDDTPTATAATGELTRIRTVELAALMAQKDWLTERGEIRRYWMWGKIWFGVHKRPLAVTTITIVCEAVPPVLSVNALTATPSIQDVYHTVMCEIAVGLLLIKEGIPDGQRGLQRIQQALQLQQVTNA